MLSQGWALLAMLGMGVSCREGSSPIAEARADPLLLHPQPATIPRMAVVELFTSEGCSSCPPADALLERIARDASAAGRPLVTLAFHVDYWDGLGWPDRFSSPEFTARQRDYARVFGESGVYTPQMIVGGTVAFVGSDRERAEASLANASAGPVGLTLRVARADSTMLAVHYEVLGPLPDRALLLFAVVQRTASVHVAAGENGGRTLRHTSIVRALASSLLRTAIGDAVVRTPWAPAPDEDDVVALVQRTEGPDKMTILGAATRAVP
jgi:hypothetical protein